MGVPLFDTSTPLEELRDELRAAVARVLDSERYILGPEVSAFEREFASYCGAGHAVGVANGTDAITIALRAMGVGPGDEVVVPSFTFYASAEAIPPTGARPVFCDIDPDTYCVTAETVRAALTPRTKAVIAVHLFGNVAPVARDRGAGRAGAGGRGPSRRLALGGGTPRRAGHCGDVLVLPVQEPRGLRRWRDDHDIRRGPGESARRYCASTARATRSPTSRSATTRAWTSCRRRSCASSFHTSMRGRTDAARRGATTRRQGWAQLMSLPRAVDGAAPAWHLYVVAHRQVERLEGALAAADIGHKPYYRTPVHRQGAMRKWGAGVELPGTEQAARTHLAIPMSPLLTREQADQVVAAARNAS